MGFELEASDTSTVILNHEAKGEPIQRRGHSVYPNRRNGEGQLASFMDLSIRANTKPTADIIGSMKQLSVVLHICGGSRL